MKQELTDLRNGFYDSMPTGKLSAWDYTLWTKEVFEGLDKFIDAIPEHLPLSREQADPSVLLEALEEKGKEDKAVTP
jgi:hypothetical protein